MNVPLSEQAAADLVALYQDLHQHPELSFAEQRTAASVAERLTRYGYDVTTGVGRTGVVGLLRNGAGPTILLRADMDALPVLEETGLPYASTARGVDPDGHDVPLMHACGHDVHVTCLVGASQVLAETRSSWSGTLMVVFQPAEELGTGAQAMIDDGLSSDSRGLRSCWGSTSPPSRRAPSPCEPALPSLPQTASGSGCSAGADMDRAQRHRSTRS